MSNFFQTSKGIQDIMSQGAQDTASPQTLLPSRIPKAISARHKMISVASSNGAQASASGMLLFNIPSQGYLKPGSVYLKFQFSATTTAAAAYAFNFLSGSVASCFNRVSLSAGAGQQIEVINNYNLFHELLLSHTTSYDYVKQDATITEGTTRNNFADTTTYFFTVPIASSVLQNAKAFPLWMVPGGLTMQIDLETASRALKAGLTFTITNAILCAEIVSPDEAFLQTLRNEMISNNKLYEIPLVQCQSLQTSRTQTTDLNYLAGVNLSSVISVFWGEITTSIDQGNQQKLVLNPMSAANDSTSYDRQLLVDGEKRIAYAIQSNSMVYEELQRCISGLTDGNCTSTVDYSSFPTNSFWNGICLQKFPQNDVCMRGSPVGNMQLLLQSNGANPAGSNCYIFIVYDAVLVISPQNGSVVVAK
jgi:hypothetical protein